MTKVKFLFWWVSGWGRLHLSGAQRGLKSLLLIVILSSLAMTQRVYKGIPKTPAENSYI